MVGSKINRQPERGLTLVELLVVIVILALASSVVLLTAPPSRPKVREDAERFAARLQIALDDAIVSGRSSRLAIDAVGYRFQSLDGDEWRDIETVKNLAPIEFDRRTTATPTVPDAANDNVRALGHDETGTGASDKEEAEDEKSLTVPLDPLGEQMPLTLRFSSPDGVFTVSLDEGAAITVRDDAKAR